MFGIGVYFALQNRNALAKAGCILLGYLGAVIMHGLVERFVADRARDLLRGLPALDGADLRAGDRARRPKPAQGAADRRREAARHGRGGPGDRRTRRHGWARCATARPAIGEAARLGGKPARKAVKNFAAQVVELAFVRDRIDRGFGDDRVYRDAERGGLRGARGTCGRARAAGPRAGSRHRRCVPSGQVTRCCPPCSYWRSLSWCRHRWRGVWLAATGLETRRGA